MSMETTRKNLLIKYYHDMFNMRWGEMWYADIIKPLVDSVAESERLRSEAEAAIAGLNGKTLKERIIVVNESRPRTENRGGSFGNRRGGYGSGGYGGGRGGRSGGGRQRRY